MNAAALRRHGVLAALLALAACGGSVDRQDPTAALLAPLDGATGLAGVLVIRADASDNQSVQRVEFQVDGVEVGRVETPPYTVSVDTSPYADGQHVVRVRARDEVKRTSPWASATVQFVNGRSVQAGFEKNEAWASGFADAHAFAQAADGRMFVAERGGALRVVGTDGSVLGTFATLAVDTTGERGLLGVALHPDFASNGWVYVYYTTLAGGTHNRVSRLTANGNAVQPGSETVLADLPALASTVRNGGALHFGADGKLYVGVGDDGGHGQDLSSPFGKLLRLNDDGSVPDDGPFATQQSGLARAIWAYGLRDPATFAFSPDSGQLFVNDRGQSAWEEIDVGSAGANYGWPNDEGPTGDHGVTAPLFAYAHAPSNPPGVGPGGFFVGQAIAGGAFYPASGGAFPDAMRGHYFFADATARFVARLDPGTEQAAYAFATLADAPVDLLVGSDGALYVLTKGGITRIRVPS